MAEFSRERKHNQIEKGDEPNPLDVGQDPFRLERETFIARWVVNNDTISAFAKEHLRKLVMSENGLWNDVENVTGVVEYEDVPGAVFICYALDGEELEIPV